MKKIKKVTHTQGKWEVKDSSDICEYMKRLVMPKLSICSKNGEEVIALILNDSRYFPASQAKADAHRICQAVNNFDSMLEALKLVKKKLFIVENKLSKSEYNNIVSVINKATPKNKNRKKKKK